MTALPDLSMNVYLAHGAVASMSMADANLKGVRSFDPNKIDPRNQILTIGVCVVAATSLLTGLFAMYIEASIIAYLAFAFPLITGPMVISQRRKIQWIPTFQEECNKMRLSVNELAMERNRLEIENARLERQMKRLSAVEGRFDQVVTREGYDLAHLKNLVKQNGDIQRETKKLQAAIEMQDLITLILKSDKDGDNRVSEEEMEQFFLRLKHFRGRRDRLNKDAIKDAFRSSLTKTVQSLLQVTASMMEDAGGEENNADYSSQRAAPESTVYSSQQAAPAQYDQRTIEIPVMATGLTHDQPREEQHNSLAAALAVDLTQAESMDAVAAAVVDLTQAESMDAKIDLYVPDGQSESRTFSEDGLLAALLSSNSKEFVAGSVSSLDAEFEVQSRKLDPPTSVNIPNKAFSNV